MSIVVDELIEKLKFNSERKDKEWESAFRKVLSYYLDEKEIAELLK